MPRGAFRNGAIRGAARCMQGRPEGVAYRSSDDGVRSQSGLDDSLREEAG